MILFYIKITHMVLSDWSTLVDTTTHVSTMFGQIVFPDMNFGEFPLFSLHSGDPARHRDANPEGIYLL